MIRIAGGGIAGRAVAQLLRSKGMQYHFESASAHSLHAVLLSPEIVDLIQNIFGINNFANHGTEIRGRLLHDLSGGTQFLDFPAVSFSMASLLDALPDLNSCAEAENNSSMTVDATGRAAIHSLHWSGGQMYRYGARVVLCARAPGRLDLAQMFLTSDGWTFAFPLSRNEVVVQSMTISPPENPKAALLAAIESCPAICTNLKIDAISDIAVVPAAPQMPECIAEPRGLAVGMSAFAMDPMSGNGVGAALHSALLAAAVCIEPTEDHLSYYVARHRRSFANHLGHVADYYKRHTQNPSWSLELRGTYKAVEQTRSLVSSPLDYRLGLTGLELASEMKDISYA